jgi:hypothetical protein
MKDKGKLFFITFTIILIILIIIYFYINVRNNYDSKLRGLHLQKRYISYKTPIHNVYIVTTHILLTLAKNLQKSLLKLNIFSEIIVNLTEEQSLNSTENDLFIIISNFSEHNFLPLRYIFYQIEQKNSKWFTPKYMNILDNADFVWDLCITNYDKYKDIVPFEKLKIIMLPFSNEKILDQKYISNANYDILFFGTHNERRYKILDNLSKKYKTKFLSETFNDERDEYIKNSKIILNLHYYEDAFLETARIIDILPYNKIIISEKSHVDDWYQMDLYKNLVIYIDKIDNNLSNIDNLYYEIDKYLQPENYNSFVNNLEKNKMELEQKTLYFLAKNLLPYYKNNINIDLEDNKIYCLHLLETPERIKIFNSQKYKPNVEIFPAIKDSSGSINNVLSYKILIYNAKRCNLDKITICEDDCIFKKDFNEKFDIINSFLNKHNNWDIFVGVMTEVPDNSIIKNVYRYKKVIFVELNKMISTVFNIYNKSSFDTIINWNEDDLDVDDNTIDQYLKRMDLKIITTYPFEFRCTNTDSTLYGSNLFDQYERMFQNSLNILENKIKNMNIIDL